VNRLRSPRSALGLLIVVLLLVSGCGLRTPSGVRVDQRSVDTTADDPDIRKLPPGPAPGASPAQIVSGFLEASAADPDHSFALDFLDTGSVWADRDAATIYEPDTASALKVTTTGAVSVVKFSAQGVGAIGAGGAFVPSQRLLNLTFQLHRVDGEWRLTRVPSGVLLTARDLNRSYRPVRTYEFSPDRSLLVAEPGYVVSDRAGLAGAALHALLTGWGDPAAAVAGGLPQGLTSLGSVVVSDGQATVDLGREAFTVPQSQRSRLVSQIAASLASVPGVFTVRVLVEDRPYAGAPVPAEIPTDLLTKSVGPVLAIGPTGELVSLDGSRGTPVKWSAHGTGTADPGPVFNPVSAPGGKRLAALRATNLGFQLVLADLASTSGSSVFTATVRHTPVIVVPPGASYLRPQWLDSGRLLLATGGSAPRLQLIDAKTGASHQVYAPNLQALGALSGFAVSRDGTRVIAVAGPPGARKIYLARVTTTSTAPANQNQLIVDGWTQVPTPLPDVAAASWSADLALTVIGAAARTAAEPAGGLRVETVSLDGVPDPTALPLLPAAVTTQAIASGGVLSVATAPGRTDLVSAGSSTWALQNAGWAAVGNWRSPAYP
jgi:hypothetical protein